jgi:circadian clock protein KaiB
MTAAARVRRTGKPSAEPEAVGPLLAGLGESPKGPGMPKYVLRLFIAGLTPRSQRALENLRVICDQHLAGRYQIEVVDLHQSPGRAHDEQIIATPTVVKVVPAPVRRIIGDLSEVDKVLRGLDLR